jgi:hypothetical protein
MGLEEELLAFLMSVEKPTSLKRDGNPRKAREPDPAIRWRNFEIVLNHFGFGEAAELWPTLEQLAERYDGLTRERIRQIIESTYTEHLPDRALPAARAAERILARQSLWSERDLLDALRSAGLIGDLKHSVGILSYLQSQGLATEYEVYLPSLQRATRATYLSDAGHLVAVPDQVGKLLKDLKAAQTLPGRAGLAKLSNVRRRGARVDHEALAELISLAGNAWSGSSGGEIWYSFEDRENVLVNEAATTFAVTSRCRVDDLAVLLAQALTKKAPPDEYPPVELIRTWITQSVHFKIKDGVAELNGEIADLSPIEKAIVKIARGNPRIPLKKISDKLVARGFTAANASKNIYSSPLLLIDKSGGRKTYVATLVSDLARGSVKPSSDYERFLARLAALGGTDRDAEGKARREQSVLGDWVFREGDVGECAVCGRAFSRGALIVAHKKKRHRCSDAERLDPHIVFPLCLFGCDYLYEHGYIAIRDGLVCRGRPALDDAVRIVVDGLAGRAVPPRWLEGPEGYFTDTAK